jgi:phosphoglycolate phosphatase-like HAD superfamily hydrolase
MRILLFDMDGVLIEPHAYHAALQRTVSLVGQALGIPELRLQAKDITAFEAAGVASEWDTAAICAALSLAHAWTVDPQRRLAGEPPQNPPPPLRLDPPDFQAFAVRLDRAGLRESRPLARVARLLQEDGASFSLEQWLMLQEIMKTARRIEGSFTHRLFQEMILGSRVFADTYGLRPSLECESFLLAYDRPTLAEDERQALLAWSQASGNWMAIFTGRPSLAPGSHFGVPEAEMGARLAGLEGAPIAALGGLSWLSWRLNRDAETFLKPNPVHALVALGLAQGREMAECLEGAAALVSQGGWQADWGPLQGAQVLVFEDTAGGLASVAAAQKLLANIGVMVEVHFYGIARERPKRRALRACGAQVFPTLVEALRQAGVIA